MPNIDVLIPVYKPDKKLYLLMEKLCRQSIPPKTIRLMVTLTGQEQELEQLREKAAEILCQTKTKEQIEVRIHGVRKTEFNHGGTRKKGVLLCESPYVVCMTQDAVPQDAFLLEHLLDAMKRYPKASSVYARQLTDDKADELTKLTQSFNYPNVELVKNRELYPMLGIKTIFCSDVCCMYDRNVFLKLGGFEERVLFNEDMIYARHAIDAGYDVIYEPEAKVIHWHSYGLKQQFHRNFDLAVSQTQHPEVFGDLSSEEEGVRMVKRVLSLLLERGEYLEIPAYIMLCAAKFIGYRFGKLFRHLPRKVVLAMTMTPSYFDTNKGK